MEGGASQERDWIRTKRDWSRTKVLNLLALDGKSGVRKFMSPKPGAQNYAELALMRDNIIRNAKYAYEEGHLVRIVVADQDSKDVIKSYISVPHRRNVRIITEKELLSTWSEYPDFKNLLPSTVADRAKEAEQSTTPDAGKKITSAKYEAMLQVLMLCTSPPGSTAVSVNLRAGYEMKNEPLHSDDSFVTNIPFEVHNPETGKWRSHIHHLNKKRMADAVRDNPGITMLPEYAVHYLRCIGRSPVANQMFTLSIDGAVTDLQERTRAIAQNRPPRTRLKQVHKKDPNAIRTWKSTIHSHHVSIRDTGLTGYTYANGQLLPQCRGLGSSEPAEAFVQWHANGPIELMVGGSGPCIGY